MGRLRNTLRLFYVALRKELYDIATSLSSVILIVGGMVAYGLLYNLMYHPNVVHEAPVVVVDNSHTSLSRHFISLIDASPKAVVVASVADMSDARSMLSRGRAEAILYLPNDTDRRIARGEQAIFVTLSSTATLLYYEATVEAIMEAMLSLDDAIRDDILRLLPAPVVATIGQGSSTEVVGNALFNPTKGYADYLIPVVFVVIIFQTMVMVVSMHSAERNARRALFVGGGSVGFCERITIVLARSATYCAIYGLLSLFLVGLLPIIFRLPHLASGYNLIMLMCPFMLATSLFGQAFGRLFSDREAPIVLITFFSVGLIFLSGISYPLELMPIGWQSLHYLLPAAPATLAFVELNSMHSSLVDIAPHLGILWLQSAAYLLLATIPKRGFR